MNVHRILTKSALSGLLRGAALSAALGIGSGCQPRGAFAPSAPQDDPGFEAERAPPRPGVGEDPTAPDLIHPGDVLAMRMLGDKDEGTQALTVDRGGFVHVPLAGDVRVADRTLTEAEGDLQAAIGRYDRIGRVLLSMVEAKSHYATVVGAVEHPGNVPLIGDARLADVIATSGGPRSAVASEQLIAMGDIDGARLVRGGVTIPVDARKALEGDPHHNVRVHPGDLIYVPPSLAARVVVLGYVSKPASLPFREGLRLTEALAEAGGLTPAADLGDVRILRGGYAHPRLYVTSVRDLFAGRRSDPRLAAGDVIYVSEHWFATVGEVMEKVIPATMAAVLVSSAFKAK
jgi:polysaccharide biosynthesis/export protein